MALSLLWQAMQYPPLPSGRQSNALLGAFIAGCVVTQVELSKTYTMTEWREDCKALLVRAGADGLDSCFLFSDTQIKYEGFLEDLNNLLNAGETLIVFVHWLAHPP